MSPDLDVLAATAVVLCPGLAAPWLADRHLTCRMASTRTAEITIALDMTGTQSPSRTYGVSSLESGTSTTKVS
ncbi:hypothetical protein [Acrocarpospora macrocephala]|uniref:hypothetical protein n=1 Tax=Acrocarpospora macrocephala TaxID=150177 RepID=UPI0012D2B1B2|nr:hypothetical protein [Acrocarpospora macrocephala]